MKRLLPASRLAGAGSGFGQPRRPPPRRPIAAADRCFRRLAPAAARPANDDTILVRLPNQATMTLYVKNKAQLRELRNYKLDSLIVLLDTYITQAENGQQELDF